VVAPPVKPDLTAALVITGVGLVIAVVLGAATRNLNAATVALSLLSLLLLLFRKRRAYFLRLSLSRSRSVDRTRE